MTVDKSVSEDVKHRNPTMNTFGLRDIYTTQNRTNQNPLFYTIKINSRWTIILKVESKTIKLSEKNTTFMTLSYADLLKR